MFQAKKTMLYKHFALVFIVFLTGHYNLQCQLLLIETKRSGQDQPKTQPPPDRSTVAKISQFYLKLVDLNWIGGNLSKKKTGKSVCGSNRSVNRPIRADSTQFEPIPNGGQEATRAATSGGRLGMDGSIGGWGRLGTMAR